VSTSPSPCLVRWMCNWTTTLTGKSRRMRVSHARGCPLLMLARSVGAQRHPGPRAPCADSADHDVACVRALYCLPTANTHPFPSIVTLTASVRGQASVPSRGVLAGGTGVCHGWVTGSRVQASLVHAALPPKVTTLRAEPVLSHPSRHRSALSPLATLGTPLWLVKFACPAPWCRVVPYCILNECTVDRLLVRQRGTGPSLAESASCWGGHNTK
jgi:hypothetical protein